MAKTIEKIVVTKMYVEVDIATTLKETTELIETSRYDYVITDLKLPDAMNGEVVDALNAKRLYPIIFTGIYDDDVRELFETKKIVDYITKDNYSSIIEAVNMLIQLKKNREIKVLVVDDSASFRYLFRNSIKLHNFQYFEAKDGLKALEVLEQNPDIKVMITDYHMDVMDGYELVQKVRKKYDKNRLSIITLTSDTNSFVTSKFLKAGSNDFLNKPFSRDEFYARFYQNLNLLMNFEYMTHSLEDQFVFTLINTIEKKSNYTGSHAKRVGELSYYIAKKIGLGEDEAIRLKKAAPLHDVGKIAIPDELLNSAKKYTQEDLEVMQKHTIHGFNILSENLGNDELFHFAAMIALEHHEQYDGNGYPYGRSGDETSIYSRIVGLCDVFDSLASKRPYKEPWPKERIIEYFENYSAIKFDPKLAQRMVDNIDDLLEIVQKY
jgi:putative two-component system response regulator